MKTLLSFSLFLSLLLHAAFLNAQCACPNFTDAALNSADCTNGVTACDVCFGDQITLTAEGTNLPSGGTVDWYYSNTPSFNPYLGQGTFMGSGVITNPTFACTGAECPSIIGIYVDACDTEHENEFAVVYSGEGFSVDEATLDLAISNNTIGTDNDDINTGGTSPCTWQCPQPSLMASLTSDAGCSDANFIPVGPGEFVPPGAAVFVFTNAVVSHDFDFSAICLVGQSVYIMQSSCNRSIGAFTNQGTRSPGPRTTSFTAGCGCSNSATYNTADLSIGTGGDFVVFPPFGFPPVYSNSGCTPIINNLPPGNNMPTLSMVAPVNFTTTQNMCNNGPFYAIGIVNPAPNAPCTQILTDPQAFNVVCPIANPASLEACSANGVANFDLTQANTEVIGATGATQVIWYNDATGNSPIGNPTNFSNSGGTAFASIVVNGCTSAPIAVMLTVTAGPTVVPPANQNACQSFTFPMINGSNLTGNEYYSSMPNGGGTVFPIGSMTNNSGTYYANSGMGACIDSEAFSITIVEPPVITNPGPTTVCGSYMLPTIQGSNLSGSQAYYTGPNGTGTQLPVGLEIFNTTMVCMYDETASDGNCSSNECYTITIALGPDVFNPGPQSSCGSFIFPAISGSNTINPMYYDAPNGGGTSYSPGQSTSIGGTYYIYDGTAPCSDEEQFEITITPAPILDVVQNVTACGSYVLPVITGTNLTGNEAYYNTSGGGGAPLQPGFAVTFDGAEVFIYDSAGAGCDDETSFMITILDEPQLDNPGNQTVCDSYELPNITGTNVSINASYWTQSGGNGTQLFPGELISATQTIYIYDGATGCDDEEQFDVTITAAPIIFNAGPYVADCSFALPIIDGDNLTGNQAYYELPDAGGQMYNIGDVITASITLYPYDGVTGCEGQNQIVITINEGPLIDPYAEVNVCGTYTLPSITGANLTGNEQYYDDPNGQNVSATQAGDMVSVNTTVYAFDGTGTCSSDEVLVINIVAAPILDPLGPITADCSYELPAITGQNLTGNEAYYDDMNGQTLSATQAGDNITTNTTLYIYDGVAGCEDEIELVITINEGPLIDPYAEVNVCGTYTLPSITGANLTGNEQYYDDPNGQNVSATQAGDMVSVNTTVYAFDGTGTCSSDEVLVINIVAAPILDPLGPITADCSYELPAITGQNLTGNEAYYDDMNGQTLSATQAGDNITTNTTLYIYDGVAGCEDEIELVITINEGPLIDPYAEVNVCGTYTLPSITGANLTGNEQYYDDPNGQNVSATQAGDMVSVNTTVYAFDGTGTCSSDEVLVINIVAAPILDPLGPITADCSYELPAITGQNLTGNEAYYDDMNGQTLSATQAGDNITTNTTLYIYDGVAGCEDEIELVITINASSVIDPYAPVNGCDSYEIPAITGMNLTGNEQYYTDQNGATVSTVQAGDMVTTSMILYAFDSAGGCDTEEILDITITITPILDVVGDVVACGSYILPAIIGQNLDGSEAYFTEPNGQGTQFQPGDLVTTNQTCYIFAGTPDCFDEVSFNIQITPQPSLDPIADENVCGDFTFPAIAGSNFTGNQAYYTEPNGMGDTYNAGDIFSAATGDYTFYIYDGTATCNAEQSFTLTIFEPLMVTNFNLNCSTDNLMYNVDFQITGGDNTCYEVNGNLHGTFYIGDEMNTGDAYMFTITSDCAGCEPVVVSGIGNCACDTNAGTMDLTEMLDLCVPDVANATHNGDEFLETLAGEEDALQFVLHDNAGGILGTVYATNGTPNFIYDASYPLNTTLYISAIAGNDDGNGNVDTTDPCLSVAAGVPVAWHDLPTATINAPDAVCEGDNYNVEITFTGTAPFTFMLEENNVGQSITTNDNPYNYAATATTTTIYQVTLLEDAFCENSMPSNANTTGVATEILIENITYTCAPDLSSYIVEFDVINGIAPYQIIGMPGAFVGNHFTGEMIDNMMFYFYEVSDSMACNSIEVQGAFVCEPDMCANETGDMDISTPLDLCVGDAAIGTYDPTGENLDGGILQFAIGEGGGFLSGDDFLAVNNIPEFAWDATLYMTNTIYSIVAIVGPDADGDGDVDLDDPCTVISEGQIAYWHESNANFAFADTLICANTCVDLIVEFSGVQPFEFTITENGGNPVMLSSMNYTYEYEVCPTTNSSYQITQISNYACPGEVAAPSVVNVNIAEPLSFNVIHTCLGSDNFQVDIIMMGGVPPYTVTGDAGSFGGGGNIFTSGVYANDAPYQFTINDANGCGPLEVNGTYNCACTTYSGTLDIPAQPLEICIGDELNFTFNNDNILDDDDNFIFVLQDQNSNMGFGNSLVESFTPNFTPFQYVPVITAGQTYYIAAVAGNEQANSIDPNDPCLSISQSIPVVFYQMPEVSLTGNATLCGDECADVILDMTGTPPFDIVLDIGGTPQAFQSPNNQLVVNICPSDYGVTNGELDVFATLITNPACSTDYGNNPPLVTISTSTPEQGILDVNLCPGGTITVGNVEFSEAFPMGVVDFPLGSYLGCDSSVVVTVNFDNLPTGDYMTTLCAGDSVLVNNIWFSESGTTIIPMGSYLNCDSVINVIIDNYPPALGEFNPSICPGTSITIAGTTFDESFPEGDVILQNAAYNLCDSILHVTVSFNGASTFTYDPLICVGDTVYANFTPYYFGNSTDTITLVGGSYLGCDSLIYVDLQFNPFTPGEFTGTFCEDDVVVVEGFDFTQFNPTDTLQIPNLGYNGCDSIIHVNLTFLPNSLSTLDMTLCEGETLQIGDQVFDQNFSSGQVTLYGQAANGCDSAVVVTIEFLEAGSIEIVETIPAGTTIDIAGATFSEANPTGEIVIAGGSATGCDSTIFVSVFFDLVLENSSTSPECFGDANGNITIDTILGGTAPFTIFINNGDERVVNNFPYDINNLEAGLYALTITDANGKVIFVDVEVTSPPEPILDLGEQIVIKLGEDAELNPITSFTNPTSILWEPSTYLECDTCLNTISIQPFETNTYRLTLVDEEGCSISELVQVIVEKDREVYIQNVFSPDNNGVNDIAFIQSGGDVVGIESFQIFNRWGALMYEAKDFQPNDRTFGWDGMQNGKAMQPQVFVYYAVVLFVDGEKRLIKGDLTLVR